MELMNAEKQRKEKKELERAKMNLVGHVVFTLEYYLLVYHTF